MTTIDDASLLAYVEGALAPDEHARVAHEVEASAELAAQVARLRASRLPYGDAFARQALPPMPAVLAGNLDALIRQHRAQAADAEVGTPPESHEDAEASPAPNVIPLRRRESRRPAFGWPKLAVAFVAGAFCCGMALQFLPRLVGGGSATRVASVAGDAMAPWIRAAAGYQQLYARDTVAALQPDTAATAAIVADIRREDGLDLQIPDLSAQGLTFKRVQRLRFHDKPLVQIVYLPAQGKPVALCVLKEAKGDAAPAGERVDGMSVVAWRRAQLGYALIAEPGDVDLGALGQRLYDGA